MSDKVSPKMKKAINLITEVTGVKYNGKTFEEASKFIETYLPKVQNVDVREIRKPSTKQLQAIERIEQTLNVSYTGKNMKDASEFLNEYLPKLQSKNKKK